MNVHTPIIQIMYTYSQTNATRHFVLPSEKQGKHKNDVKFADSGTV